MGGQTLEWEECAAEIRKCAHKYRAGYNALALDQDDLEQEAAIVALRCVEQFKAGRVVSNRQAYVRTALRNSMVKLRNRAYADRRTLKDCWGHATHPLSFDSLDAMVEHDVVLVRAPRWYVNAGLPSAPSPEARVEARELVGRLRDGLPAEDWQLLVAAFIDGAHEARALRRWRPRGKLRRETQQRLGLAVASATAILSRACYPVERGLEAMDLDFLGTLHSKTDPSRIPPCHAEGADPLGYDQDDTGCHNCPDKFRCLPLSLELKLVSRADDAEVRAVIDAGDDFTGAQRAHMRAIERMKRRLAITKAAHLKGVPPLIPPDLLTKAGTAEPKPLTQEVGVETVKVKALAQTHEELDAAASHDPVPPKAEPKRPRLKRPKPKKKPAAKPGERGTMNNGKRLPPVRQLTQAGMAKALERVKIAQPFPLEIGMQVVRKKRNGDLVVYLRETGFEWGGTIYSSLSTAAMYAERRVVSANAFFNLAQNKCTEIRDHNGRAIAGHDARYGDARYKP